MISRPILATLILGLSAIAHGWSQDAKPAAPAKTQELTAEDIKIAEDNYMLPLPGEIMAVLGKIGDEHWKKAAAALHARPAGPQDTDSGRAARLGVLVADAFLAVQAQDASLLEKISQEMLELCRKLGASDAIIDSGKKITETAAQGAWKEVMPLLDLVQGETLKALGDVGDKDSVAIATAAGWLRGTELYAEALAANYSDRGSRALRQGGLVGYLSGQLADVSGTAKGKPVTSALADALAKIKPLVSVGAKDAIAQDAVTQIGAAAKAGLSSVQ